MRVGLREANQRFSQLVRAVKLGHEVILTERGKPVVVMRPASAPAGEEAAVRLLEASGVLRVGPTAGALRPFRPRPIRGRSLSDTVREARDDD